MDRRDRRVFGTRQLQLVTVAPFLPPRALRGLVRQHCLRRERYDPALRAGPSGGHSERRWGRCLPRDDFDPGP